MSIDLSQDQIDIIRKILEAYLPKEARVWAFGSRVRGGAKQYSDLDLLIDVNGEPCSVSLLAELNYDLEESDLPFKVDILDWNTISESFKKNIENDRVDFKIS